MKLKNISTAKEMAKKEQINKNLIEELTCTEYKMLNKILKMNE